MTEEKQIINEEKTKQVRHKNSINTFKIKCRFNEQADSLENVIEKAFGSYVGARVGKEYP